MRRIASLAVVAGLVWLLMSFIAIKDAQAGWFGANVDPACPGGTTGLSGTCPTAYEGCFSWALFYNAQNPIVFSMTPFYDGNGNLAGYTCPVNYVPIENGPGLTEPTCTTGHEDASVPSGCSDFVAPSPEQLGICTRCTNNHGREAAVVDPVDLATGNVFEEVTDYSSAGPDKLEFKRYYNSQSNILSSLGFSWKSNFDRAIFGKPGAPPNTGGVNLIWRPDGQALYLLDTPATTGWAVYYSDNDGRIATDGATVWTYTDSDDTVETYAYATGKLLSIRTRSGYQQTLSYDANGNLAAVTDSYNRTLSFTYANGLLQTMTDPDGRVYTYAYDFVSTGSPLLSPNPRLTGVTYPGAAPAPQIQYLHEDARFPFALTGIIDENGNRASSWTYDSARRAATSQRAGGADLVTFGPYNYNVDTSNWFTNALGEQFADWFVADRGKIKLRAAGQAANGTVAGALSWVWYDGNGFVSARQDRNGIVTNYTNDARGLVLSKTEASGTAQQRVTTYTWLPNFHLPTQIVEPGRTTSFTYDANGFLLSKTETDTTTATLPYSTNGRTRTWTYTYTPAGLVQTVKGPRTDVDDTVTYAWDASGTLVSVTNPLGQVTQVTSHDASGRPLTTVDANGVTTTLAYDARGRVISASTDGATTMIAYDLVGNVTRITQPDGSFLAYGYDAANRLVRIADALDERIDYTLDALGNRTLEQIHGPGGTTLAKTQSRVFDVLGRLFHSIGAAGQTATYGYDSEDRLLSTTDPLTHVTGQSFDALNRLIKVAAPLSSTTSYAYDAHDNRTSVTDPRGLVTAYVYDGLDNLIQVKSPDTGTTVYVVDDAGNRIEQTDAAGVVVQMSYDALNRLTAKTYPVDPTQNVTYRYDEPAAGFGVGRLTSVSDTSGSTSYVYDARGNVVQETHVVGAQSYITSYAYDLANHVVQITYPSGRIVNYTRNAMGRISDVTTQANSPAVPVTVASGATYAPFGPLTALTYGNGLSLSITYDEDYQPSARLVTGTASVQDLAYGFDADGNITGITDHLAAARSQTFQYDALDRLTYASGLYGALAYGYDAIGNRTSQSGGTTNLAETYSYAANSNQLQSVVNGTVTRSLGYSPTGNVASDNRGNGTALSFSYDLSDRMVQVANQNTPLASYAYNYLGQRAAKTTSSAITQFVYDRAGHLLAESNGATGGAQTEYVWLDDMPLALVTGGNLYFIHSDQLNTPQKATDASQTLAWDIVVRPFGQTEQQTFPPLSNLRFPGQYFDSESGLDQNWFRDYDPSIGRYIESDPTGLEGGLNAYAYVRNNAINFNDLFGLAPNACNARCGQLKKQILQKYNDLLDELRKYNPEQDATGGWPMAGGGTTKPGGHYQEMKQLQKGLKNDIAEYNRVCKDQDGDDGEGPWGALPRSFDRAANRFIPPPLLPPPEQKFLPLPDGLPPLRPISPGDGGRRLNPAYP